MRSQRCASCECTREAGVSSPDEVRVRRMRSVWQLERKLGRGVSRKRGMDGGMVTYR